MYSIERWGRLVLLYVTSNLQDSINCHEKASINVQKHPSVLI